MALPSITTRRMTSLLLAVTVAVLLVQLAASTRKPVAGSSTSRSATNQRSYYEKKEAPTCGTNEGCSGGGRMMSDQCDLLRFGSFVLSGKDIDKDDFLDLPADVAIPVTLHTDVSQGVWPMWSRFVYFHPQTLNETMNDLVFSPGLRTSPFQCHKTLNNVQPTLPLHKLHRQQALERRHRRLSLNDDDEATKHYKAKVPIRRGDPVFVTCEDDEKSSIQEIRQFPKWSRIKDRTGECVDRIVPGVSEVHGKGAFAKYAIGNDEVFATADMIHMHRSELFDEEASKQELLLNYCFGNPKSNMLLLPSGYMVNYINHDGKNPNVAIRWNEEILAQDHFFQEPSEIWMRVDENAMLQVEYYALRDIAQGEELVMDYGSAFEAAWRAHKDKCSGASSSGGDDSEEQRECLESFRHEIALPGGMYPDAWLAREKLQTPKLPSWDVSELKPGQVRPLTVLETGEQPAKYSVRVGLPPDLSKKLLDYADSMGITDLLRHYVNHAPLEKEGQIRHRLNGGTWWVKRFDSTWQSNMHYITPDDPIANMDFMSALSEAGFDQVLEGMGEHFGYSGIVCFYPSFIAVSHCTGTMLHSDAEETNGKGWNMIFPVLQVNESSPELNLGYDEPQTTVLPYRYEPNAGITLGDDGLHGTAPCDYRSRQDDSLRMVASVYFADVDEDNIDAVYWDETMDPPYPYHRVRKDYLWANAGRDWNSEDPDQRLPTREEFAAVVRGEKSFYDPDTGYAY